MKVKCITTEQYLDLAALGLPIWSSVGSWEREQHEEGLIKFLSHPPAQERERERGCCRSNASYYGTFFTLVEDDSDES